MNLVENEDHGQFGNSTVFFVIAQTKPVLLFMKVLVTLCCSYQYVIFMCNIFVKLSIIIQLLQSPRIARCKQCKHRYIYVVTGRYHSYRDTTL